MTHFIFWQKWLLYSSLLFAFWGILLAVDGYNILLSAYNVGLCESLWGQKSFPLIAEPFHRFILGPLGGTIAACYILLAYIAAYPFKNREPWARNAVILAFATWAIIDSAIAIYNHVYFHVYVVNIFSIVIKALPLIFTWRAFEKEKVNSSHKPISLG